MRAAQFAMDARGRLMERDSCEEGVLLFRVPTYPRGRLLLSNQFGWSERKKLCGAARKASISQ